MAKAQEKPRKTGSSETSTSPEYWFDERAAANAVKFFETFLVHIKGKWADTPLKLAPWQADEIIRPLFGWKRANGTRKYRHCYIEVPRKNGKSTMLAGIGLLLLVGDNEPGAEIYSAAADQKQAGLVFEIAKQMVTRSSDLAEIAKPYRNSIAVGTTASSYHVLSADAYTKHGLHAHGILFDELHAQKTRDLWDVLQTSTGAREQPLDIAITTAGHDRHSICWEIHDYAIKVRDGVIDDPAFLPVIYAADEDDDWTSETVWRKANPNLGISLSLDYLKAECKKAQELPSYENTFRRLHLNQWTEQDVRWLSMEAWNACDKPLDLEFLKGRECYAGLDLSAKIDLSAFVLIFPLDDGEFALLPFFWVPRENAHARETRDKVPYLQWAREGHITLTDGNVIDYEAIEAKICELAGTYQIKEIAFDPWNAQATANRLANEGMTMVEFRQGFVSMSGPTKDFEVLIIGKKLIHGGHPVLKWNASNVAVKEDPAGNLKPNKQKSTERIDGIVAAIMGLGRSLVSEDDKGSVYEGRGLLTL